MTVPLLQLPRTLTVDANGTPRSNAKLYVFAAQTTNPVQVWQDSELTIPHPVPIRSNAEGTFPPIYADPTLGDLKINITDEGDVQIPGYPIDNIPAPFDFSQDSVGALLHPITLAEIVAGAMPVNRAYEPGNLWRWLTAAQTADALAYTYTQDCTAAINTWISVSNSLYAPGGGYKTSGGHTINAKQDIYGDGIQRTIFQHSSTSTILFSLPLYGVNQANVEFGGNRFRDFSCVGQGPTNTSEVGFYVKNKTDIKWDHVEITGFGYGVQGARDNAGNSCTQLTFIACRVLNCGYALWAPLQWNACQFIGGCWEGTIMSMVIYDAANTTVNTNTQTPTGASCAVFAAGCQGCTFQMYCEGSATVASGALTWLPFSAFVILSSAKDINNLANPGGINIQVNQANRVVGGVYGSAGGVAYACLQNGGSSCAYESLNTGSGIGSGAVYLISGTLWNLIGVNFSNAGVNAVYQTPADQAFNFELNRYTGSGRLPAVDTASIFLDEGNASDTAEIAINKVGYQGGVTKFRRFTVYDGKGAILMQIDGQNASINLNTIKVFAANLPTSNPGAGSNQLWVNGAVVTRA